MRLSSQTPKLLDFGRRYCEYLLDSLFPLVDQVGPSGWWRDVAEELRFAVSARAQRDHAGLAGHQPTSRFPPAESPPGLSDEAVWYLANRLKKLYETVSSEDWRGPFDELPLVQLSADRYAVYIAAASLPDPKAKAHLTARAWDDLLSDLTASVFLDFRYWLKQRSDPEVAVEELLVAAAPSFQGLGWSDGSGGPEADRDGWLRFVTGIAQTLPEVHRSVLRKPIREVSLAQVDSLIEGFLARASAELTLPTRLLTGADGRREVFGVALDSMELARGSGGADHWDALALEYLRDPERRGEIEREVGDFLLTRLQGMGFEVVIALPGQLVQEFEAPELKLILANSGPITERPERQGSYCYAYFRDVRAVTHEEAVFECRRKLVLMLSTVGAVSRRGLDFEVARTYVRDSSRADWMSIGRAPALPVNRVDSRSWNDAIQLVSILAQSDTDFDVRLREALVHMNRAESARDPEECVDEVWKMLELVGGNAAQVAETTLCYAVLYYARRDFGTLSEKDRVASLHQSFQQALRGFGQIKRARNQAVVHRPVAKADWKVLENHAQWALSFARQVLTSCLSIRLAGANSAQEMRGKIDSAYWMTFGCHLPPHQVLMKKVRRGRL